MGPERVEVTDARPEDLAVTNGIDQLVTAGVLIALGESKRNRAWEAEGLLDIIEALEAGK